MSLTKEEVGAYLGELDRLHADALYSGQTYFEAYKRLTRVSRSLIFTPACLSALAAFLVAVGLPKWLAAISAISSVVVATASYVGADRKPAGFLKSAQAFTQLRHDIRRTRELAQEFDSLSNLRESVVALGARYSDIVGSSEPTSNRDYKLVDKRVKAGTFNYD